jgi:hypothetical protein
VSTYSAKWGEWKGEIEEDHLQQINWSFTRDSLHLYRHIAKLLAEKERQSEHTQKEIPVEPVD